MSYYFSNIFSNTAAVIKTKYTAVALDTTTTDGVLSLLQQNFGSLDAVKHNVVRMSTHPIDWYTTTDPLITAFYIALTTGLVCYLLSVPTNKYSWVDKLWSILPPTFVVHFTMHPLLTTSTTMTDLITHHPRLIIATVLPLIWGTRLTYNFYRRGGYAFSSEDYRWVYVQKLPVIGHPLIWQPFNLMFIGFYQCVLLMLIATPAYIVYLDAVKNINTSQPLTVYDIMITLAWLALFATEVTADQQQWWFYERRTKYQALSKPEQSRQADQYGDERRGFYTGGLFKYSRHPNFWAEQSLWLVYYMFSVVTLTGGKMTNLHDGVNWSLIGSAMLSLSIFQASTWLTEMISQGKYPAYKQYKQTTSRFLPLPAGDATWKSKSL